MQRDVFIPADATQVLFLEQSAHCDWDWVATFHDYYANGGGGHQAVRTTLNQATSNIASDPQYVYSFCESGYLQAYMTDNTVNPANLRKFAGTRFLFSSGGITSAENLTLHTEAFIRNYLVGRQWLWDTFGVTASNRLWIPDDFGHDAQLPVLLQAMGMTGTAFERIPYGPGVLSGLCGPATPNAPSAFLPAIGLDFIWQAADGSQVQSHFLSAGYCEGNAFPANGGSNGGGTITVDQSAATIEGFIRQNTQGLAQPTPYLFVPIDCDFTAPYTNLPAVVNSWNNDRFGPNKKPGMSYPTTWVVQSTFDEFMDYVASHGGLTTVLSNPASGNAFVPHPYYSGCYGSRPLLKSLHFEATRTLLLAESMELALEMLARRNGGAWITAADEATRLLRIAWGLLAPSTHHDYITGTSPDNVYKPEQVDLLGAALAAAVAAREFVLTEVAAGITLTPYAGEDVSVFNCLGFERSGVVDLKNAPSGYQSATVDGRSYYPLQYYGGGAMLFAPSVPSLGFENVTLSTNVPNADPAQVEADQPIVNGVVSMSNAFVDARIEVTGVTHLARHNGSNTLSGPATLAFYNDTGNIYRFANEMPCFSQAPCQPAKFGNSGAVFTNTSLTLVEKGPLRARAVFTGTVLNEQYTITYELYANDIALRVTVDGAAPQYFSVMARVPFVKPAAQLTYGTTAHWDTRAPRSYFQWQSSYNANFEQTTFEPTHEFVVARDANGGQCGTVFHPATPGWAIDSHGALLGCILRNTPCGGNAASGSDGDAHTVRFALRPGDVILPDASAWGENVVLAEALDMHNPLAGVLTPVSSQKVISTTSMLRTTDHRVLITAAKNGTVTPGSMIVRLSRPANRPLSGAVVVTVDANLAAGYLNGSVIAAQSATALETAASQNNVTSTSSTTVTVNLPYALSTIALGAAPPQR